MNLVSGKNNLDKIIISYSIVLYRTDKILLKKTIDSFKRCNLNIQLYLIDNSPTNVL
jgi:hypothetical protein